MDRQRLDSNTCVTKPQYQTYSMNGISRDEPTGNYLPSASQIIFPVKSIEDNFQDRVNNKESQSLPCRTLSVLSSIEQTNCKDPGFWRTFEAQVPQSYSQGRLIKERRGF